MINKKTILFLLCLILPSFGMADQVILKEGKTLLGTITEEDRQGLTLKIGKNMFLQIEKSKVEKIIRSKKKSSDSHVITMDSMKDKKKKEEKTKPKKALKEGAVNNLEDSLQVRTINFDNFDIGQTVITKTYPVQGNRFETIERNIYDRSYGKGFLMGRKRDASKTVVDWSWNGLMTQENGKSLWTSLVLSSTMTLTLPRWKAPKKPDSVTREKWNSYINRLKNHDLGHVKIALEYMQQFGESLLVLRAKNDQKLQEKSDRIFKSIKKRTTSRQKGHDRRFQGRSPLKKDTP